ncbi:ABC transporter ATP-binding protein [Limnochorda pilosa]|uniref:ABC transporter n=1 Tax=Limnochorda pilosa TaxID=1555112 RepID=A0A0K2SIH4_LIMPI|nr:ABC transporter ATP-binding protein [Limnochorda pilosa]BAS26908.1 ABC transporter [Limnochorda pilosa]
MIVAEHLTKVFRLGRKGPPWRREWEEKQAVNDLSFEVPPGRITGLLGVNGAGKTTTIKMLATLLLPTRGRVLLDGIDVAREPARVRPLINLIAGGERAIYGRLTGRENLWYFGQLYDIESSLLRRRTEELLEVVGLQDAADTPVEKYSKGMKQRLQIARGLLNDPRYLFMDEPTLGLDAPIARQLRRMTRDLAQEHGRGVLLTSHYMFEVEELCDHVYVLDRGELVAEGPPQAIKALTGGERVTRVTASGWDEASSGKLRSLLTDLGLQADVSLADGLVTIGVRGKEDVTPILVEAVSGPGRRVLRVESEEPSLEDAIVAIAEGNGVPHGNRASKGGTTSA